MSFRVPTPENTWGSNRPTKEFAASPAARRQRVKKLNTLEEKVRDAIANDFQEDYRSAFEAFDVNGDQLISPNEFGNILRNVTPDIDDSEVKDLFHHYCKDLGGKLSFYEFVKAFGPKKPTNKRPTTAGRPSCDPSVRCHVDKCKSEGIPPSGYCRFHVLSYNRAHDLEGVLKRKVNEKWSSIHTAFQSVKDDHDQSIDKIELMVLLKKLNLQISDRDLSRLLDKHGLDEGGRVNLDAFRTAFGPIQVPMLSGSHVPVPKLGMRDTIRPTTADALDFISKDDNDEKRLRTDITSNWEDISNKFRQVNANHRISTGALVNLLKSYKIPCDEEQLFRIVRKYQRHFRGVMSYTDFQNFFGPTANLANRVLDVMPTRLPGRFLTKEDGAALKAVQDKIASRMGSQWTKVREAFRACDRNFDGHIDGQEFKNVMRRFNFALTDKEMSIVMDAYDTDHNGRLDYAEFQSAFGNAIQPIGGPPLISASNGQPLRPPSSPSPQSPQQRKPPSPTPLAIPSSRRAMSPAGGLRPKSPEQMIRAASRGSQGPGSRGGSPSPHPHHVRSPTPPAASGHRSPSPALQPGKPPRAESPARLAGGSLVNHGVEKLFGEKVSDTWAKVGEAFKACDQNRDGTIDRAEFCNIIDKFNLPMTAGQRENLLNRLDKSGDGKLDYREFQTVFGEFIQPTTKSNLSYGVAALATANPNAFGANRPPSPAQKFHDFKSKSSEFFDREEGETSPVRRLSVYSPNVRPGKNYDLPNRKHSVAAVEQKIVEKMADKWATVGAAFRACDTDHSGALDPNEFEGVLEQFNLVLTEPEKEVLYTKLDTSGDGFVNYGEFQKAFAGGIQPTAAVFGQKQRPPSRGASPVKIEFDAKAGNQGRKLGLDSLEETLGQKMMENYKRVGAAFNSCDKDRNGTIDADEFMGVLKRFNMELDHGQRAALMARFDLNKDGRLDYVEFQKAFGMNIQPGATTLRDQQGRPPSTAGSHRPRSQQSRNNNGAVRIQSPEQLSPVRRTPPLQLNSLGSNVKSGLGSSSRHYRTGTPNTGHSRRTTSASPELEMYEEWKGFHRDLKSLDHNHDGKITRDQFNSVLSKHGVSVSESKLKSLYSKFNPSQDGLVVYNQVVRYLMNRSPTKARSTTSFVSSGSPAGGPEVTAAQAQQMLEERMYQHWRELRQCFRKMDANHDGSIDKRELRQVLKDYAINVPRPEFKKLFKQYDTNGDGRIKYDEFLRPLLKGFGL